MALVPQFTTGTVADPVTMNKLADAVNSNAAAIANIANTSGLITLLSGWLNNGIYRYSASGKTTVINMRVKSGSLTQWSSIGSIPREFAPTEQVLDFAYNSSGGVIGIIIANLDGNVQIYSLSTNADVIINMSWGRS